ncbi:MAG: phage tail tip lysozyme [Candidatus Saccharimonadales bacterium]
MHLRRAVTIFVATFFVVQAVILPSGLRRAAALSTEDKQAIINDWSHWVPNNGACRSAAGDSSSLSGKDNQEKGFNFFLQKGLTPEQAAAFIGNFMQESTMNPAAVEPNGVGHGIAQWSKYDPANPKNGGRWDHDPNDNLKDFAKDRSMLDLATQLDFVWYELTETHYKSALEDLRTKSTLPDMVLSIANNYETAGIIGPRLGFAEDVLDRYGKNYVASTTSTSPTTGCVSSTGAVTGNVVQTALNYAWDTRGHGPDEADAKPTYRRDMPVINGATADSPYSDCGVFVSTVMIASGADKDYPKRVTGIQEDYLRAHPNKYQEIKNVTNTSQLQPGDILVNSVHTFMFVGAQPKGFDSVGGSHYDHVPQATGFYDGFSVFRLKGGTTT